MQKIIIIIQHCLSLQLSRDFETRLKIYPFSGVQIVGSGAKKIVIGANNKGDERNKTRRDWEDNLRRNLSRQHVAKRMGLLH